ncbi:MAG: bifunctional fucokinase/L-fucose-1-P-guanylyltransferase [Lachnospiraceae bacterium]|nr:bifunctional fucokinase/L-fucose-1-P-guanylyltransferase [Lachnospiraceae bacterium]
MTTGWDYIILTASNEEQARGYRLQLDHRKKCGFLPDDCAIAVLPDPAGKRVGSGGATFHVLKYLAEKAMEGGERCPAESCLKGRKILVIHSGGDSRRVPQYSVCGKLFSPVPRELPDGRFSTLFDEFILSMADVANKIKEGMLVLSGDVLLLFDFQNEQFQKIDFTFQGCAAISIKEPVNTGKNHGVFLTGQDGMVEQFLHKQPEDMLRRSGAVNEKGCVDLDTGAVLFDSELLGALLGLISTDGRIDGEKYSQFVNEKARISFYGDFLYPLASGASLTEFYRQAPEGNYCKELQTCREQIWRALSKFSMRVISLSPAKFIHFGTTEELLDFLTNKMDEYRSFGWIKAAGTNREECGSAECRFAVRNSFLSPEAVVFEGSYLENSELGKGVTVMEGAVLSGAAVENITVPAHTVLHAVRQKSGRYAARVYGVKDNPKGSYKENAAFLNGHIREMLEYYRIPVREIWEGEADSLWEAKLYPLEESCQEAAESSLILCEMAEKKADKDKVMEWLGKERISLCGSFNQADVEAVIPFEQELRNRIQTDREAQRLIEQGAYGSAMRLYEAHGMEQECFAVIRRQIADGMKGSCGFREDLRIVKDEVKIELPLRVNWGGGWTDTPPYCNEHGGMVLNAAIRLNGILPAQAAVRKLAQYQIEFESEDLGAKTVIHELSQLQDCMDPYDNFALHKAALTACGLIPAKEEAAGEDGSLEKILRRLGGGIYLSTKVVGVPKGSGLGTSSILAGACAKAIAEFTGTEAKRELLFNQVLYMEQLMSTGGGWQDQAGGILPGIKMITSKPGARQILEAEPVHVDEGTKEELNRRFAVIYTGQRRLARNLLREVVGNYIRGRCESVQALEQMKQTARRMKRALEKGDVDELARLFNHHWNLSLQLDAGASNPGIDRIFEAIEDLIDGRFIAGAGGGGFVQIIMKSNVSAEQVNQRLKEAFPGTEIALWNSELYFEQ